MPQFNVQMITNILASALTATVASLLSYLAAWSHFSSTDNTALATVIAAGLAIMIGQILTIVINRWSVLVNRVAQDGTKVVVKDQKVADSTNNPDVVGPSDVKVTKIAGVALAIGLGLMLSMFSFDISAQAQIKKPQFTGDIKADIAANNKTFSNLPAIKTPQEIAQDADDLFRAVTLIQVADFENAIRVFEAANNYNGKNCFDAMLKVVKATATAFPPDAPAATDTAATPSAAAAKAADLPIKNLFTVIAVVYNMHVANQPGGAVSSQCAAMKQDFGNSNTPIGKLLKLPALSKVLPFVGMMFGLP